MTSGRDLIIAVSRCAHVAVQGEFGRHTSLRWRALTGSQAGGRWGPPGTFSVLYLGRPEASVVVEAYRHLVDRVEGMTPEMVAPRRLLVVAVGVTNVLDLRAREAQEAVGLSSQDLESGIGEYEPCWAVARAAHQLGLHGILAPAATGLGETLALFEENLPATEMPTIAEESIWDGLPADPRQLRAIDQEEYG